MKRSVLFLSLLIVVSTLSGCANESHDSDHEGEDKHATHEEVRIERIHLSEETQKALSITTAVVEIKPLEQILEVTGQITQDTERFTHVHPPQAGILSEIKAAVGERVSADDVVAVIESKEMSEPVEVKAPHSGLVIGIHATKQASVDTLTSLMTLADLSQVSATFDFYEQDAGIVAVGQLIDVHSVAYPTRAFTGRVIFVSPQIDEHTRMLKVRAQVENPDYALKLGMFVIGRLYIPTLKEALVIPRSAVQLIENESFVFVKVDSGKFIPSEIQLGETTIREAQVLSGLSAGQMVVTDGSFHLKAEMLKGSLEEGDAH